MTGVAVADQVQIDLQPVLRFIDRAVSNQVPFASALALTQTAKDIQQVERTEELPKRFTLRNRWVQQGIVITPATKGRLIAAVGSRDHFMALQAMGGTKRPQRSKNVSIPKDVKRNKRDLITRSNRPRQLLDRRRVFVNRIRGGTLAILQRLTRKRYPLKVLYVLSPFAKVKPRWALDETAKRVTQSRWAANFVASMIRAMGSRKDR